MRCQFHQRLTRAFFVRKFVQSQNITRKKVSVRKIREFHVDEIDYRMNSIKQTSPKIVAALLYSLYKCLNILKHYLKKTNKKCSYYEAG